MRVLSGPLNPVQDSGGAYSSMKGKESRTPRGNSKPGLNGFYSFHPKRMSETSNGTCISTISHGVSCIGAELRSKGGP